MSTTIQWTDEVRYVELDEFPGYRVGSDGSVWSQWVHNGHQPRKRSLNWKQLKPQPDGDGYLGLNLFKDGKPYRRKVHLLVILNFIGPRPDGMEACHDNGVLSDCMVSNLRWDTKEKNQQDRLKHGTHSRGEKSAKAKLTESQVLEIRQRLHAGAVKKALAIEFGVAPSTISAIAAGKLWGWLKQVSSGVTTPSIPFVLD